MFAPGEVNNPQGRIKNNTTQMLRDAIELAGKGRHTNPFARIAELFYSSGKMAIAILPYITPKLRTLEVSGEVTVPFQFVIESAAGMPIALPQPARQVTSQVLPLLTNKDSTTKPGQTVVNPIKNDKCKAPRIAATKHTRTHAAKLRTAKHKPAAKRRANAK